MFNALKDIKMLQTCVFRLYFFREFSKYPPPQARHERFVRRPKDTTFRNPTPESLKNIPRDQIYQIMHPLK